MKVFVHLFQTKRGAVVSSGLSPGAQAKPKEGPQAPDGFAGVGGA